MNAQAAFLPPVRRDLNAIRDRLAEWLSTRIADAGDLTVDDLEYPSGAGLSNETILFEARWTAAGESRRQGYVLRLRPGPYRVYLELDFHTQFLLQRQLFALGVTPVPNTLWYEPSDALFGAPFYVMSRLHGRVPVTYPPYATHGWVAEASDAQRHKMWRNAITALAKIHHVPLARLRMLDKPRYGASGWEQEWNYWMKSYAWARGERVLPTCDQALAWLRDHMPEARPSGLCWGDARIGNVMFDDNFEVLAVMDWEGASLGGSLQDLGYWLALDAVMTMMSGVHPQGFGSREETIELWEQVSGAPARDVFWYEVFAGFKLASHVARKLALDGNARPGFDYNDNGATRYLAGKLGLAAPVAVA